MSIDTVAWMGDDIDFYSILFGETKVHLRSFEYYNFRIVIATAPLEGRRHVKPSKKISLHRNVDTS